MLMVANTLVTQGFCTPEDRDSMLRPWGTHEASPSPEKQVFGPIRQKSCRTLLTFRHKGEGTLEPSRGSENPKHELFVTFQPPTDNIDPPSEPPLCQGAGCWVLGTLDWLCAQAHPASTLGSQKRVKNETFYPCCFPVMPLGSGVLFL